MKNIRISWEKFFVVLTAVFLCAPLPLTILFQYSRPWGKWLRTNALAGVQTPRQSTPFSKASLLGGKYQESLAANFNAEFAGRTGLIFLTNEFYFRLFRICPAKSAGIVIGKKNTLYMTAYLDEYCLQRTTESELDPLARDLKRLQDACQRHGTAFVLVITPSKAAIYPEHLPEIWLRRHDSRPRSYDLFVPLLRREGVRFVDGHAITAEARRSEPAPVFPKGGIHWSRYAAWLTTNAVVASLQSQGKPVRTVQCEEMTISDRPYGEDADVIALMNLVVPWRYPVAEIKVMQYAGPGPRPTLVITGGSFVWKIAGLLNDSRQFSEMDVYYYYKTHKTAFVNGFGTRVAEPVKSVDFEREIFAADCLVLEINEQMLYNPSTTKSFLADALKNLPAEGKPKAKFLYSFPAK